MPKKPKTKKIKDTDYLTISARIRGMENTLMNRDKMEQLLETHSDERLRDPGAHGGLSGSLWRPSLLGKTGRYVLRESNKGRQNFQSFHGDRQIII